MKLTTLTTTLALLIGATSAQGGENIAAQETVIATTLRKMSCRLFSRIMGSTRGESDLFKGLVIGYIMGNAEGSKFADKGPLSMMVIGCELTPDENFHDLLTGLASAEGDNRDAKDP